MARKDNLAFLVFNCSSVAFSYIIIGKIYSDKLKSNLQTLIVVEENFLEGEFKRTWQ